MNCARLWPEAPGTKNPRIDAEFPEEERIAMGMAWFRQEYLCEFVDSGAAMVDRGMVERALREDVLPLELRVKPRTWE
jgi:phage FluMu gp28-like protein